MAKGALEPAPVSVRVKLAALWGALMSCFIYGDYFELYQPGKLDAMLAGRTAIGPVSQGVLMAFAGLLSVPALMIALSVTAPPALGRWLNIALGLAYAAVMGLAIQGSWRFYTYLGVVEIGVCMAIVWHAVRWPRRQDGTPGA